MEKVKRMGFIAVTIVTLWSQMNIGALALDGTSTQQSTKHVSIDHRISKTNHSNISQVDAIKNRDRNAKHPKVMDANPFDLSKVNNRQIIVSFKRNTSTDLHIKGLTLVKNVNNPKSAEIVQIYQVESNINYSEVLKEIRQNSDVADANPDYLKKVDFTPTDASIRDQWYLGKVNMFKAWDVSQGTENPVVVAVLDSGVDANNPELAGKVLPGYDFVNNDNDPSDDFWHGSSVAGIIAANANEGETVGIDFNVKILPVKVADNTGMLSDSAIIQGIYYAIDHGADVINMSFGGQEYDQAENDALYAAHNAGIVLVAAAGNEASSNWDYPAADNNVIGVSATNENDSLASFSNWGDWVDVAAPGTNIHTIDNENGYIDGGGTSFSAPIVSGIAALLKSEHSTWSADDIEWAIEKGTDLAGEGNWNQQFGYRRVNAYSAITAVLPSDTSKPVNPVVLKSGQAVRETLSGPNEQDTYQFDVATASKVTITFSGGASYFDLAGELYQDQNDELTDIGTIDDQDKGQGESYTFNADPGSYDFSIYDYYDHWSPTPYTVKVDIQEVPVPLASIQSGTFDKPFQVTLTSNDGSPIKYTLDGSAPTSTHGESYTGPIQITNSTTLKAVTVSSIGLSNIATYTYTFEKVFTGDVTDPATRIPVLMYHGLLTTAENTQYINNSNFVQVEHFEEQMKYLADNGFHTVTAKEMDEYLTGKIELPRKSVMIQFDDGLRSVYRYAFPIMQKYGLHGLANIITSRTDGYYGTDWDPNKNQYMDHTMLDAISTVFDLESHTNQLHYLDGATSGFMLETPDNVITDLQTSRQDLAKYGNVDLLAYPFGQYNSERIGLVKQAGFSQAYTIKKGYVQSWDDPYQLNRTAIYPWTSLSDFIGIVTDTVEPIFSDIPLTHPNFKQTFWLYSHHIIKGYPDGHFGPNVGITRAQAAKMLVQALGISVPDSVALAPFKDIPLNYSDPYLVKAVSALKNAGIFNGDQGNFRPREILSREQMATVLVNTFHWHSNESNIVVKDLSQASTSHQANIEILAQKGITVIPDGVFSPHDATKRIHLASFLYKALHLE